MTRAGLAAFTPIYRAVAGAKNLAYDRGWLKTNRLAWPVISVGNLSVGGSGKTPLVIHLAELLRSEGLAPDVLSRGYGRTSSATERVDTEGDATRFGDEPILIAQRTGAPVYVGADRFVAGQLAESVPVPFGLHLLDDGFQHRRLARAVDVVVVHRSDLDASLLPAGRLREPLGALRRASIVVLREDDAALRSRLQQKGIDKPVWLMRRSTVVPAMTGKIIAFCGIARPDEFFTTLHGANVLVAEARPFRDHQPYGEDEIARLAELAREHKATGFVTTEKDVVRMGKKMRARLETTAPVHVARLEVTLLHAAECVRDLMLRIGMGEPHAR